MTNMLYIEPFPLNNLSFVGTLLFKEYPSTVVYSDKALNPYILEWVDVDEQTGLDRYFIYQTSVKYLKAYIDKRISHYDLILSAKGGIAFMFDNNIESAKNTGVLDVNRITQDYLPSPNSFFHVEDSNDVNDVLSTFNLNKLTDDLDLYENINAAELGVEYQSLKLKTELFRIHLNNGKYISHGKAQTDVLGTTLINFEKLYFEVASDQVKGKDRATKVASKDKDIFEKISHTEVVLNQAASFSIFVRPLATHTEINFSDETIEPLSAGERIFASINEIISNSINPENIEKIKDNYNSAVFDKLRVFSEHVIRSGLTIDLNYYSPSTENGWSKKIGMIEAGNILDTLSKTSVKYEDKRTEVGKFTALNCKTGHFTFFTNEEVEYTGYFEKLVAPNMPNLNFVDFYTVTFERSEVKNIADAEVKFETKIVSALPASSKG